ncbi:MAG TPA: sensor domain-containing diguanylate cyclase [Solirubrobacteraceae bacterium]|jgi:diguanylate cyclase (GGDEF)-like protein|nr:sensor domain-containing diguanylate cyclase [Solirubrobacteraceae bacterium]
MGARQDFARQDFDGGIEPVEHIALSLAPFAAAAALAAALALVGTTVDWTQYAAALGLGFLAGLVRLTRWKGALGKAEEVLPSLIFLGAVAFLRSSASGANAGVAVVALLPVFWTALYGDSRQLCVVTVGVAVFFLAPPLLVGAPAYPSSQYRAGVLFLAVSAIIGFTTQWLVAKVRFQANEAEHREQALERVAAVMRGLSNSPRARAEVCEAARSIGNATFAMLYEPVDVPGTLRSTAIAGVDVPPLEIAPDTDNISAAREAFASQRSLLWREGDDPGLLNSELWETVGRPGSILFEPVLRGKDPVGVLVVGWPGMIRAGGTRATMITLLAHEVAAAIERADLMSQLTDMASTDALTGLPNRRAWETSLNQALLDREPFVLAMLDFDLFKSFNDSRGHPAGDRLLKETAAAWREELRAGDFLARIGGEEFALLLPKCSPQDALMVVERLRRRVPYEQTCSAGVIVRELGESQEGLMTRVDEALYVAKTAGRDRVSVVG